MTEIFELELLGGSVLDKYRALRPEVEAMPWGTLDASLYPAELRTAAQRAWTAAAFQEHRTGAACAATLRSLIEARAPLDLVALASRFPLDELVHVELCARLAQAFGGAVAIEHDPAALVVPVGEGCEPLLKAAHQVVCFFCVGEALSIPLLHGTWKASTHPLTREVLKRIVRDEADHGSFGWAFLDWAQLHLTESDRRDLAATAKLAIDSVRENWADLRSRPRSEWAGDLGWMETDAYLDLAARSLQTHVLSPLRERGIEVEAV